MTTREIAERLIAAGPYFRELLGEGDNVTLAITDDGRICHGPGGWYCHDQLSEESRPLPEWVAVAAVVEYWRKRLEEEHGIRMSRLARIPSRKGDSPPRLPSWVASLGLGGEVVGKGAFHEAICGAGVWLALEKRKAEKARAQEQAEKPKVFITLLAACYTQDELATYRRSVLLEAAKEVESHWNNTGIMVDQKTQAARSAHVLRRMAEKAT